MFFDFFVVNFKKISYICCRLICFINNLIKYFCKFSSYHEKKLKKQYQLHCLLM